MSKNSIQNPFTTDIFNDTLWAKPPLSRSEELTPLYVSRYVGPRMTRNYTVHDYFELLCVMRDTGDFCRPDCGPIRLRQGMVLLIPPGQNHYEYSKESLDTIWIGLIGDRMNAIPKNLIVDVKCRNLSNDFEQLYFASRRRNSNSGAILDAMSALIVAKFLAKQSSRSTGGMEQAIRYFHENFDQPVNISQLAHDMGYSEGYFYRSFKKIYNMTPGEYWSKIRIEHALEMIYRTTLPFYQIARRCGIKDGLYLSRLVKNATGRSPRDLRKLSQKSTQPSHRG